ncbi:MAG: hypothetical protein ABI647_23195 [Gemmatimonadota bacterium]
MEFGKTTANNFLGGNVAGNYSNAAFSISASSAVSEKLSVSSLLHWEQNGVDHKIEFSYAFATWRLSKSFDLRVGKVKHPGNLYSEVFDVGTLRPFLSLPQTIYGGACLAFDHYTGLGLNGKVFAGAWELGISAYGGGGACPYQSARTALGAALSGKPAATSTSARNMLGGRMTIRPPITGLTLGVTAQRAVAEPVGTPALDATQIGGQLEYLTDKLWLRAELAHTNTKTQSAQGGAAVFRSTGYYVEAAYFLVPSWQIAAQAGRLKDKIFEAQPLPADLDYHREIAIGLNRWLTTNMVFKASYHWVRGNRLAYPNPADLLAAFSTGQLQPRTRLFELGGQFSF